MNKVKLSIENNKILEDSAKLIFDEITQNLCLVKLVLASSESAQFNSQNENNKKCCELINRSISQLRQVAESINEIKNKIQS